ncbi:DUF6906 family protein [Pseudogracilibacillus sp. SE30717A]|uniref:DUF6906 family protein n=1 Tax=Pseudogracilibacillus sp. SE30717A TaxID=3098293 RepID=UPI003FA78341
MRGKRLTLKEKKYIGSLGLKPENWLMHRKYENEWIIVNKISKKPRRVPAK